LSSDILPEYREYERTATTVINAYVQPLVARYLARLEQMLAAQLPGTRPAVHIMQSNGGVIGLKQAAAQAARVVLSGPAGGAVGAFAVAEQAMRSSLSNLPSLSETCAVNLITFDMGGTSTDVALCPGHIPTTAESTITDLPLRLPVIDIHTVGAGGGSIAFVDAGGALQVGRAAPALCQGQPATGAAATCRQ
jgi:N-methylhydantoinase A